MSFEERLALLGERLSAAERASGRPPGSARVIAVSKLQPERAIREAYAAGQRHFGENYPQELAQKARALADLPGLVFHLIGHLQSNKAKLAAEHAGVLHTLSSAALAREVGRRAASLDRVLPVLVEVNVGGEAQKHGCAPAELGPVLEAIGREPSLALRGLMTVPPYTDDPEGARPFFAALRALRDLHGGCGPLPELSMGMSHDAHVAVAEGATLVRVGTALFGARA